MPTNNFVPVAAAAGANVTTDANWQGSSFQVSGVTKGIVPSAGMNKAWRQATVPASAVAQIIVDHGGIDAVDDGNVTGFKSNLRMSTAAMLAKVYSANDTSGTPNVLTASLDPAPPGLSSVFRVTIRVANTNTGAATLNLNSFGAIGIVKRDGTPILAGDLTAGLTYSFIYTGGNFRLTDYTYSDLHPVPTPYSGTTQAGGFYTMDLGTQQVFSLPNPASIAPGWTCALLVTGTPSGYQSAYAQISAGSGGTALTYRGTNHTPFYLIGNGEIFQFTWTGSYFVVYTLCQPASFGIYAYNTSSAGSFVGGTGANTYLPINAVSQSVPGAAAAFNRSSTAASLTVPVSGIYQIVASTRFLGQNASFYKSTLYLADSTAINVGYYFQTCEISNMFSNYPSVQLNAYLKQGSSLSGVLQVPSNVSYDAGASVFSVFLQQR